MAEKTSPFLEAKWGWPYGSNGWNSGADENWLKFSYMFDRNVDGIVSSLPPAVNGQAYFNTTDNRFYFVVDGTYYSSPCPKWFVFVVRSSGETYQFDGSSVTQSATNDQLDSRLSYVEEKVEENLGPSTTQPTSREDGTPLRLGDRYFNTVDGLEYLYKSTGWEPNNLDGQLLLTDEGANLVGYNDLKIYDHGTVGEKLKNTETTAKTAQRYASFTMRNAPPEMYSRNRQMDIVRFNFSGVPSGTVTAIPAKLKKAIVGTVVANNSNVVNSGGTFLGAPSYTPTPVVGSAPMPDDLLRISTDSLTNEFDPLTSIAYTVKIDGVAQRVTALHTYTFDIGYQTDDNTDLVVRPRCQLYFSENGTSWTAIGGVEAIDGLDEKFAAQGPAGNKYFIRKDVTLQLTSTALQRFIDGAGSAHLRLCFATDNAHSANRSVNRRILLSNIRIDGTVSMDITSSSVNSVIRAQDGYFHGWPANGFHGKWGNRIVISYERGVWVDNPDGHDIDYNTDFVEFSTSNDGGATWVHSVKPNVVLPGDVVESSIVPRGTLNLANYNFALMFRDQFCWWTTDQGATFSGPSYINNVQSTFNFKSRTSYEIVDGSNLLFLPTVTRVTPGVGQSRREHTRLFTSSNGTLTINNSGVVFGGELQFGSVPDASDAYSLMAQPVKMGEGHYIVAIRECQYSDKWIGIYETVDNFATAPILISRIAQDNHNPPAILRLDDLTLVVIYGTRENGPKGMCATVSKDGGYTWSVPGYFRKDAASWDFGYPLAFLTDAGDVLTAYYYHTTAMPYQYIAQSVISRAALLALPARGPQNLTDSGA